MKTYEQVVDAIHDWTMNGELSLEECEQRLRQLSSHLASCLQSVTEELDTRDMVDGA